MAIGQPRAGEAVPLVTAPTGSPAAPSTGCPERAIPRPVTTRPTSRRSSGD